MDTIYLLVQHYNTFQSCTTYLSFSNSYTIYPIPGILTFLSDQRVIRLISVLDWPKFDYDIEYSCFPLKFSIVTA